MDQIPHPPLGSLSERSTRRKRPKRVLKSITEIQKSTNDSDFMYCRDEIQLIKLLPRSKELEIPPKKHSPRIIPLMQGHQSNWTLDEPSQIQSPVPLVCDGLATSSPNVDVSIRSDDDTLDYLSSIRESISVFPECSYPVPSISFPTNKDPLDEIISLMTSRESFESDQASYSSHNYSMSVRSSKPLKLPRLLPKLVPEEHQVNERGNLVVEAVPVAILSAMQRKKQRKIKKMRA